jgi:hypothetical protein
MAAWCAVSCQRVSNSNQKWTDTFVLVVSLDLLYIKYVCCSDTAGSDWISIQRVMLTLPSGSSHPCQHNTWHQLYIIGKQQPHLKWRGTPIQFICRWRGRKVGKSQHFHSPRDDVVLFKKKIKINKRYYYIRIQRSQQWRERKLILFYTDQFWRVRALPNESIKDNYFGGFALASI